ncbi:hypothetical protein [Microbacterium sp. T32]|uniref:hypothetical protein n=1 Tax=Microbacterium sp. T32 TaxID=1776083 RepID=UPI0007ABC50D|nr:hypothetical protein [Microbacterium sp. T32]KZE41395.1 hypothetical protein AVW09_02065 [Microbacterium sp. T32]
MSYPTTITSEAFQAVRADFLRAETAHRNATLDEMQRLIPEGVTGLIFRLNDTPRLTFDGFYVEGEDEERWAEEIDQYTDELNDTLDLMAAELGICDFEGADDLFMRRDPDSDEEAWVVMPEGWDRL